MWYRMYLKSKLCGKWNNDEKVCGNENFHNFKEKLKKLFLHSLFFFPHHHRSLFSSKERKSWCIRAHKYNQYFFIGEKRSYDRINCLLKTRFNIDNWTGIETHDYVYIYLYIVMKKIILSHLTFLFAHFQCWCVFFHLKRTRKSLFS